MAKQRTLKDRTVSPKTSVTKVKKPRKIRTNSALQDQAKKLVYSASNEDLSKLGKNSPLTRFYWSLSPEAREVFSFIYFNPILEIIRHERRLGSRARLYSQRKYPDEHKMSELHVEITRYAMSIEYCQDQAYKTLLGITLLNFKKEHPVVMDTFKKQLEGLKSGALESAKVISGALKLRLDQINRIASGGLESALQK